MGFNQFHNISFYYTTFCNVCVCILYTYLRVGLFFFFYLFFVYISHALLICGSSTASTDKKKPAEDALNTRGDFIDSNEIGDGSPDAITEKKTTEQLSSETSGSRSMAFVCPALVSSVIVFTSLMRLIRF